MLFYFDSNLFRLLPFQLIFCLSFKCIAGLLWGKERYKLKILANLCDIDHYFFIAGICGRRHVSGDEQQRPYPPWLCPPHSQDFQTDEDQGNLNMPFSRLSYDWPNIPDGSLSSSPANYCWWALADHEECELPGRAGPLVHHAVPVPDQTADKEHVNDKDQGWYVKVCL